MTVKQDAVALLKEHDAMRRQLRLLEQRLDKECADYGRLTLNCWGYTKDMLRRDTLADKGDGK